MRITLAAAIVLATSCVIRASSTPPESDRRESRSETRSEARDLDQGHRDADSSSGTETTPPDPGTPSQSMWTPEHAITMALAEPLEFVGRFDGDDIGMFAKICLWRNAYVLLRVDYCSGVAALGVPSAPEAWVMGSVIYSPRGEEVSLYAEVQPPTSVYTAPRSAYTLFKVEYADSSAAGGFHLGLDVDGYVAFTQAANALPFGSYSSCYEDFELVTRQEGNREITTTRNLGRARCSHSPRDFEEAWTRIATSYLRDPPELWFTYLDAIKVLVAKGKNKNSTNMLVHRRVDELVTVGVVPAAGHGVDRGHAQSRR